jgi:energy-converting hydrogenase Eha subunit H
MADGRTFHEATLLADGRVLVTGGDPDGWIYRGPFLASAELYDPKTGTFSPTGAMAQARTSQSATLLADGRVMVAGGFAGDADVGTAEIYDVDAGTFRLVGSGG